MYKRQLLSIQAHDTDSGIKAIYVNGYEFTDHTNGALNIRLQPVSYTHLLDGKERLRILHEYFNQDTMEPFRFSFKDLAESGKSEMCIRDRFSPDGKYLIQGSVTPAVPRPPGGGSPA